MFPFLLCGQSSCICHCPTYLRQTWAFTLTFIMTKNKVLHQDVFLKDRPFSLSVGLTLWPWELMACEKHMTLHLTSYSRTAPSGPAELIPYCNAGGNTEHMTQMITDPTTHGKFKSFVLNTMMYRIAICSAMVCTNIFAGKWKFYADLCWGLCSNIFNIHNNSHPRK